MSRPQTACKQILSKSLSTSTNYDITPFFRNCVAAPNIFLSAVEVDNGQTCDVDIQVSLDGTNYEEVLSFTQLSATGHELKAFTIPPWGKYVRAAVTLSGAAGWTVALYAAGPVEGGVGE